MLLDRVTVWPRWVLALIGLWLVWRGIDTLCKARWGERFRRAFGPPGYGSVVWCFFLCWSACCPSRSQVPFRCGRPPTFGQISSARIPWERTVWGGTSCRVLSYGARVALVVGVGCTAIGLAIGTAVGMMAGYWRGRSEVVIDILTDSLLAFPALVFLLGLVVILRPHLSTLFIAFTILIIPTVIRLAKGNTYAFANREFVRAARALGASHRRIVVREILPNLIPSLLTFSMVVVASVIIGEATLSFFGCGHPAPHAILGEHDCGRRDKTPTISSRAPGACGGPVSHCDGL